MKNIVELINELPDGLHENLVENTDGVKTLIKKGNSRILFLDGVVKIQAAGSINLSSQK